MKRIARRIPCLLLMLPPALRAQMPFNTDDTEVTPPGTLHVEAFDELDALQSSQFPDRRQNTTNVKVNAGLPHRLELDVDAPYITIDRAAGIAASRGIGDLDFGVKWKLVDADGLRPAVATSLYIEVPTGNARKELGSGLTDYWLNFIAQEVITERTRVNANLGLLFAGNTSTGVIGIRTTRGHVLTGGLAVVHDVTSRLTLGAEVYGGRADNEGLQRTQLQGLLGAGYQLTRSMTLTLGILGGKYSASPRLGGQLGIAIDLRGHEE